MNNIIKRTWNKNSIVTIEDLRGMAFQAESGAHTFEISAIDGDGNPVSLSGTASGVMLRPDNTDVALTCAVSGGKVTATLPAECYGVPGRAGITIFLTSDSQKVAIYAAVVSVSRTQSGNASPGTTQSVVDLINAINAAIAAIPASDTNIKAAMAPTYSGTGLYSVGQYAWDGGVLYKCITPITSAENPRVAAHWAAAALGNDVFDLKSAIDYLFEIIDNKYINKSTGNPGSSDDYCITGFIPVADYVKVYTVDSFNSNAGYSFYNIDKYPITNSYGGIYEIRNTLTQLDAPEGAAFFRVSCLKSQKSRLRVIYDAANVVSKLANEDISNTFGAITYMPGYVVNANGTIGNYHADSGYVSAIIPVYPGEVYYIAGAGTTNARLWSLHTSAKTTTRAADANAAVGGNSPIKLIVGSTERYLVYNSSASASGHIVKCGDNANTTFNTRMIAHERLKTIESAQTNANTAITALQTLTEPLKYTYRNNLVSDGVESLPPGTQIYLNGSESNDNYGVDKAKYVIPLAETNLIHLYFEYQFVEPVGVIGASASDCVRLFRYAGATSAAIWKDSFNRSIVPHNNLYVGGFNTSGSYFRDAFANAAMYKYYDGDPAFSVRYTGNGSSASIEWSATSAVITVDGETVGTVPITATDPVSDLVDALNAVTDIECKAIAVSGKTCGQLLYKESSAASINLIGTYTYNNGTQYTDAPAVIFSYALDEKWHTMEAIIQIGQSYATGYYAFDGYTTMGGIPRSSISGGTLIIGGDSDTVAPIRMRNLQIDVGHTGDAEVVKSVAPPYSSKYQLISDHNPRLLIYEGHGVDVCMDDDGYISDDMAVSTDRLMILFAALQAKKYVPVTWRDVVDWKINNKPLPKRCFTLMMDDWRFSNYVDVYKRVPFEKYNVKPGLAVISDTPNLSDEITVNGVTYTAGQMIEITKNAGWYPSSHTKNHRIITNYKPSELIALFREDAISCNLHNIYSDVLTYPQGLFNPEDITAFMLSPFKVGVSIVQNWYNCRAANDAYLTRVELGFRETLENVLAPIV